MFEGSLNYVYYAARLVVIGPTIPNLNLHLVQKFICTGHLSTSLDSSSLLIYFLLRSLKFDQTGLQGKMDLRFGLFQVSWHFSPANFSLLNLFPCIQSRFEWL